MNHYTITDPATNVDPVDHDAELDRLDRIADLMDSAVRIPGTGIRIGLDSIIGLVPGVGDTLALLPGAWIIWSAYRMGVPKHTLGRMGANAAIDWAVGSVPVLGDIFDVGFKSKKRNVRLLREALGRTRRA